jgi:hypothetical protein
MKIVFTIMILGYLFVANEAFSVMRAAQINHNQMIERVSHNQ